MPSIETTLFTFNGGLPRPRPGHPVRDAFWTLYDELRAAGQYPYNACFTGRIPGLEHLDRPDGENTGVYLLQKLRDLVEGCERVGELEKAGYQRIRSLPPVRRGSVTDCRVPFEDIAVVDRFLPDQPLPEGPRCSSGKAARSSPARVCSEASCSACWRRARPHRGRRLEASRRCTCDDALRADHHHDDRDNVAAYLPSNYRVIHTEPST